MNTHILQNIVLVLYLFYFFLRRKCVVNKTGLTIPQLIALFPLLTCLVHADLDEPNTTVDDSINLKMNVEQFKEKAPHLLCNDEQETETITTIINEAVAELKELATSEEGYTLYSSVEPELFLYFKKIHNDDVGKLKFYILDPTKLENLVDRIWDINGSKVMDPNFIEGRIVRVYDNNTVLIYQCYKGSFGFEGRYFYVLANKKKIDENNYVITCVSVNVNDSYSAQEPTATGFSLVNNSCTYTGGRKHDNMFHNPFVKKANTLLIHLNPYESNLNTSSKKMFINLSGYVIKRDHLKIDVTYVSSVQLGLSAMIPAFILKKIKANKMMLLQALKNDL